MSKPLVSKLLGEVYAACYDDKPMDPRRLKRLFRLDHFSETIHKGIMAGENSRLIRLERRAR
jgi:hypothetical protein